MSAKITPVEGYSFLPEHLKVEARQPGISAFMRIRNGVDFLETAIRSHINYFNEIVAVYNQCTDRTEEILVALQKEFPDKLRIFHYLDRVYPPGSADHAKTPPNSPNSLVNYYNFALAQTRYTIATKLDDDHLAIETQLAQVETEIRKRGCQINQILCFSGPNLYKDSNGIVGLYPNDLISGRGDIGFFPVLKNTYFTHDRRFEKFEHGRLRRIFVGFLYYHLKYLKSGYGFNNYELDKNPDSRYGKRKKKLETFPAAISFHDAAEKVYPTGWDKLKAITGEKQRILLQQGIAFKQLVESGELGDEFIQSIYNKVIG